MDLAVVAAVKNVVIAGNSTGADFACIESFLQCAAFTHAVFAITKFAGSSVVAEFAQAINDGAGIKVPKTKFADTGRVDDGCVALVDKIHLRCGGRVASFFVAG